MATHTDPRISAARARIRRTWSELSDANRRMFDIRTGEYLIHDPWAKGSRAHKHRWAARATH